MNNLFLLKKELINNKYKLILFIIIKLINSAILIIMPYLVGNFLDNLIYYNNVNSVYEFTITLLVIIFTGSIINYIEQMIYNKLYLEVNYSLNKTLINKINKSSFIEINKYDSSYLSQRIIDDSNTVVSFILDNSIDIMVNLITFIFIVISIFIINIKISFYLICLLPINYIIYLLFKNLLYKTNLNLAESRNMYFSVVNEDINNIYFLKSNSTYSRFLERINNSFNMLYKSTVKSVKISNLFGISQQIPSSLALVILFLFGGISIINGSLSVGEFTIINTYFNMLSASISFFSGVSSSYQAYKVSSNRISEILNIDVENSGDIQFSNGIQSITLSNINLEIDGKKIINNLSYKFYKGNIYSICGENGCGKSSLINIITNIYQNYKGLVLVDDINIKHIDNYYYRENNICIIEQNPIIFNGNFFDNVCIKLKDNTNFDNIELEESLDLIYKSLQVKYNDKNLNISNNILSGGEKQKLSLVRSLLKKSDIYILDEPTNALDSLSIKYLKKYLRALKKNSIVIIITHSNEFDELIDNKLNIAKSI